MFEPFRGRVKSSHKQYSVFGGKFVPSVNNNWVKTVWVKKKTIFSILCSEPINFVKIA